MSDPNPNNTDRQQEDTHQNRQNREGWGEEGGGQPDQRAPAEGQPTQQAPAGQPNQRATGRQVNAAVSSILLNDEELLIDARPAWSAWSAHLLIAGLVFLGSLVADQSEAILVGLAVAGATVGYVAYQRKKVRYVVTDRRILVLTGISSKQTNETWMEDIRGMQSGASFLERVLGHGHITVSDSILSRGGLLGLNSFRGLTLGGISNYEEIANVVRQRQAERKSGDY